MRAAWNSVCKVTSQSRGTFFEMRTKRELSQIFFLFLVLMALMTLKLVSDSNAAIPDAFARPTLPTSEQ